MRSKQVVSDTVRHRTVGRAGFHGPPNFRRQGCARAALVTMFDRADREPDVVTVRATISPDNFASRLLVLQYGFVEVGLETIFEVAVKRLSSQKRPTRSR